LFCFAEPSHPTLRNNDGDALSAICHLYNTRWSSEWSDPQWIVFELEKEVEIKTVLKARYVRMYGEQRNGEWGYSIWEFVVYK